jgi:hypothetical protein
MYPGVYCTEHIIYLAVSAALIAAGLVLVRRFAGTERKTKAAVRISAAVLFCCIAVNRVSVTAGQIAEAPELYSWLNLLPYTFCGFASLFFSVAALIRPKDNPVYHFIVLTGLLGGTATLFYPDFLYKQTFWDVRSFSGLLHHTLMIWLALLLLSSGFFRPAFRKSWIMPAGFCAMMTLGVFELDALGFPEAMNIFVPLVGGAPVLTSWYVILAAATAAAALLGLIFDAAGRKLRA